MTLPIIDLPDDELITEPGFYRITLERHHNQPCDGPSVTSGNLRMMEKHGPSKFWTFWSGNPNRKDKGRTDALRLGKAMAYLVEGGVEELLRHFQKIPDDRPSRPTRAQYKAMARGEASSAAKRSIAFWGSVDKDPRDIITETEFDLIITMGARLATDPAAAAALGGEPEITMAWQDERTGIWCLARPDNLRTDGLLSDYKKINTQGRPFDLSFCSRVAERNGYDQQMAFGSEGFVRLAGYPASMIGLVFQEDEEPHDVILMELDEDDIHEANFLNHEALRRISECLKSSEWPKDGAIGHFHRSKENRERILERMKIANQ